MVYREVMYVEVNNGLPRHSTTTCPASSRSIRTQRRLSSIARARTVVDLVLRDGRPSFFLTIMHCLRFRSRYQDFLDSQPQESHASKAFVLQGGIRGWKAKFVDDRELLDYDM